MKKIITLSIVGLFLATGIASAYTFVDEYEMNVNPLIQDDVGDGVCQHTTEAMLMIYCDENYGTNYFGQPTDPDLLEYFGDNIGDIVLDYIDAHPNPGVVTNIEAWAWYRNQPTYNYIMQYKDYNYYIVYKGYSVTQSFCEYEIVYTNITSDFICERIMGSASPPKVNIPGHMMCGFGWNDDILVYDTWYYTPREMDVDNTPVQSSWYVRDIYEYHFPFIDTGDINGDGNVNSGDVTYLAKCLVGNPAYQNPKGGLDVNMDGNCNSADVMYLARHLIGYPGYETLYPRPN